jgi:1,5-anhydro-D-fructose reductase (1,5-anhydro-D-mannitol-forming)
VCGRSPAPGGELSVTRSISWGIVGASGIAGERLIPTMRACGQSILGVFSHSLERGQQFAHEHRLDQVYPDLDSLLADPRVDAVYIGSRNEHHEEQTIAAAGAGKHVLCEKPLALSASGARRMIDACNEAGVVLATDHHNRGHKTLQAMRDAIVDQTIGTTLGVSARFTLLLPEDLRGWRVTDRLGGGVVLDLSVHTVDCLRYLLAPREIDSVASFSSRQGLGEYGVEDGVMALIRFDDGLLAQLYDSFTVPESGTAIEVHGSAATLLGRNVIANEPVGAVFIRQAGSERELAITSHPSPYVDVLESFADAVHGDGEPIASGEDGLRSLEGALAIIESSREQRFVTLG